MPDRETIKDKYLAHFKLENTEKNNLDFNTLLIKYMTHNKINNIDDLITDDFLFQIAHDKLKSGCSLSHRLDRLYRLIKQPPDNNCLFHALCYALGLHIDHIALRRIITDYMLQNKAELIKLDFVEHEIPNGDVPRSIEEYIHYMSKNGSWGGRIEIYIAVRIFKRKIIVINHADDTEREDIDFNTKHLYTTSNKPVYLYFCSELAKVGLHYDVLIPKVQPPEEQTKDLFLDIDGESAIPLSQHTDNPYTLNLQRKFMDNITRNSNIKKETKINIVFYATGTPRSEIFLVDCLLKEGYLIDNVIMIDILYITRPQTILKMQSTLKRLYNINLLLYANYNSYIDAMNARQYNPYNPGQLHLHLIVSIHYQDYLPLPRNDDMKLHINNIKERIKTEHKIMTFYNHNKQKVPQNIILYEADLRSQTIKEEKKNLFEFHKSRLLTYCTPLKNCDQMMQINYVKN